MHHHRHAHGPVGAARQVRIARRRRRRQAGAAHVGKRHAAALEQRAVLEHRGHALAGQRLVALRTRPRVFGKARLAVGGGKRGAQLVLQHPEVAAHRGAAVLVHALGPLMVNA